MLGKLINAVLFQIVWAACVGGAATGRWWLGPLAVVGFAVWQVPRSPNPRGELRLIGLAAAAGLLIDTAFLRLGLLSYPHPGPWSQAAPIWIIALWVGFALTLNHSTVWLKGRPLAAALFGGIGGPCSFWIGAEVWRAASFAAPVPLVLAVLAIVWGAAVPLLLVAADRLSRSAPGELLETAVVLD